MVVVVPIQMVIGRSTYKILKQFKKLVPSKFFTGSWRKFGFIPQIIRYLVIWPFHLGHLTSEVDCCFLALAASFYL